MRGCLRRRGGATAGLLATGMVLALGPARAEAQAGPGGRWITEYYRAVSSHGQEGAPELARARLTLAVRGDSISGMWEDLGAPGQPLPAPRGLLGVMRNGQMELTADPVQAIIRQHIGADQRITMVTTYAVMVRGDSLVGTQQVRSTDGKITNNPRPFTAVRETP